MRLGAALAPLNRKYLGSKRLLSGRIADRIVEAAGVPETFLDGFCGTGAIGLEMLARGAGRVTAVDSLRSNCVILGGACAAPADPARPGPSRGAARAAERARAARRVHHGELRRHLLHGG